jgi:hypothetical protein
MIEWLQANRIGISAPLAQSLCFMGETGATGMLQVTSISLYFAENSDSSLSAERTRTNE